MKITTDYSWHTPQTQLVVISAACAIAGLWLMVESRAARSKRDSHASTVTQIDRMTTDAETIRGLRIAPRIATERERPNDELLAEVATAMKSAQVDPGHWIGNAPFAPIRLPGTPYKRLGTRMTFQGLDMHGIVDLAQRLTSSNASLSVSELRLSAPRDPNDKTWNVVMTVSYLIYSPHQRGPM